MIFGGQSCIEIFSGSLATGWLPGDQPLAKEPEASGRLIRGQVSVTVLLPSDKSLSIASCCLSSPKCSGPSTYCCEEVCDGVAFHPGKSCLYFQFLHDTETS